MVHRRPTLRMRYAIGCAACIKILSEWHPLTIRLHSKPDYVSANIVNGTELKCISIEQ